MAIALAQAVADLHAVSGSTITGSIGTVTAGNTLVVITYASGASPVTLSSISIGPNTGFTKLIAAPGTASTPAVEVWAMANIAAATTPSVTITFSAALSGGQDAIIMELSGMPSSVTLDPATPLANSGGPSAAPVTPSINTAGSNNIIIVGVGPAGACTAAAAPFTTNFLRTAGNSSGFSYELVTSPQTGVSCTFTTSNGLYGSLIVGLLGATGGGNVTPVLSGSVAVTGAPNVTLAYQTSLSGTSLVTGQVLPTFAVSPPPMTGSIGVTGVLSPTLAEYPALTPGIFGVSGVLNVTLGVMPTLVGSFGINGVLITNINPPGPPSSGQGAPFPFYLFRG